MAKLSLIVDSAAAEQALRNFARTTDGVTTAVDKTAGSMTRIVRSLAAVGLAYKTYDLARESLRIADAADRTARLFNVAFGGMAQEAGRWAKATAGALRMQEDEVRRAAARFQIMFENMGLGAETAAQMARDLTELGGVFQRLDTEALPKIESGMVGYTRSLRDLGIVIQDTQVQQYALQKGWIEQGQTLSDSGRAYVTYRLILEQTGKALEAVSDIQQTYGEQTRRLGVNIAETKQAIGEGLTPVVTRALETINSALEANMSHVKRWARDFKEGIEIVGTALRKLQDENQTELAARWSRLSANMQRAVARAYESERGEPVGYRNIAAPGVMGGAAAPVWQRVSDPAYLQRLIESYEHAWYGATSPERAAAAGRAAAAPAPAVAEGAAGVQFVNTEQAERVLRNLQFQYELLRMSNAEREAALALQDAAITKSHALAAAIEQEAKRLYEARRLRDLADDIGNAWGTALERIVFMAGKAGEAVRALAEDIARAVLRYTVVQPIASAISTGIMTMFTKPGMGSEGTGGYHQYHAGALVGYDAASRRSVDPLLFVGAPRLHGGLFPGEYPAVLQRGETVLPVGARPNVMVNITNNSAAPVTASAQDIQVDWRRMVLNVVLEDQQTNGPITRGFRR